MIHFASLKRRQSPARRLTKRCTRPLTAALAAAAAMRSPQVRVNAVVRRQVSGHYKPPSSVLVESVETSFSRPVGIWITCLSLIPIWILTLGLSVLALFFWDTLDSEIQSMVYELNWLEWSSLALNVLVLPVGIVMLFRMSLVGAALVFVTNVVSVIGTLLTEYRASVDSTVEGFTALELSFSIVPAFAICTYILVLVSRGSLR